jgi:hypothetical protein
LRQVEPKALFDSALTGIIITQSATKLGAASFCRCVSLSSVSFEANSGIKRIQAGLFAETALKLVTITRNIEGIGSEWFYFCESLSSVIFESNSQLKRI